MISLRGVWKSYPGQHAPALADVSFSVDTGSICGVIGLSGAGKSTLIRCITGLERVDRGSILVDSVDIAKMRGAELRDARRKLGVVFQHFNLLSQRTVLGNVLFPLEIARMPAGAAKSRAEYLLDVVGLSGKRDAYPSQLSGGQQQRVGIARALASNPSVLLCDEPTSALDPINTRAILTLIRDVSRDFGVTVLVITHELNVALQICDCVVVIDEGKIVESGPTRRIMDNPQSGVLKAMLATALEVV
ncbi:MAG: ATP-binding cassette domain-containing protein [Firmicutes bacterium]|jgi:D-methionine transport system ATP-binding protein|nr:ATP-binding cassette domain-containing protein [Bacillota bacterium]